MSRSLEPGFVITETGQTNFAKAKKQYEYPTYISSFLFANRCSHNIKLFDLLVTPSTAELQKKQTYQFLQSCSFILMICRFLLLFIIRTSCDSLRIFFYRFLVLSFFKQSITVVLKGLCFLKFTLKREVYLSI